MDLVQCGLERLLVAGAGVRRARDHVDPRALRGQRLAPQLGERVAVDLLVARVLRGVLDGRHLGEPAALDRHPYLDRPPAGLRGLTGDGLRAPSGRRGTTGRRGTPRCRGTPGRRRTSGSGGRARAAPGALRRRAQGETRAAVRLQGQQQHHGGDRRGTRQHDTAQRAVLPQCVHDLGLTARTTRDGYGGPANPPRAGPRTRPGRTRGARRCTRHRRADRGSAPAATPR